MALLFRRMVRLRSMPRRAHYKTSCACRVMLHALLADAAQQPRLRVVSTPCFAEPRMLFIGCAYRNVFDFIIVVLCAVPALEGQASLLRLLRLLRVLKLLKMIEQLQVILRGLGRGLTSISYIAMLLFLVFYLFGIIGIMLVCQMLCALVVNGS